MDKDVDAEAFKKKREETIPEKIFIRLEGEYLTDSNEVYFFYEGYDSIFYRKYGKSIFKGYGIKEYSCKCKSNIFILYRRISWESFNKHRLLFFTDKDYDKLIGKIIKEEANTNVFETKYYSVENYLGTSEVVPLLIQNFLRSYYNIIDSIILEEQSVSFFSVLNAFMDSMIPINAWIAYNRRKYFEGNEEHKLPLQKIKIKNFIAFKTPTNQGVYKFCLTKNNKQIRKLFQDKAKKQFKATIFDENIVNYYSNIITFSPLEFLRGKFLMQLYICFFNELDEDKKFKSKSSINPLKEDNIFSLLCNCISIDEYFPLDLKKFLEHNYNSIQ